MNTSEPLFFGDLLKQFRKRKRLNQTQLAERIGVTRETISLWERGQYKPESEGILYQIVEILGLTVREQQQLFEAYTVTALATSFHNPPFERNLYFTGRISHLKTLHTLLMAGKQVALTQAISGLGGIGKTQLALEYAYRYQKSYHDIFWVNADTAESLFASYGQLAELLRLPEYDAADQNTMKDGVQRWLKDRTGWLLILDNSEDLRLLKEFVPDYRQGAVLLTTRQRVTEPLAQSLELELLSEKDAILFLLKRTKVLAVDMSLEQASDRDIEAAREITHLLGNLPLALDQAGAYMLETPCSFSEYRTLFQTDRDQLLQRRISESIPTDHPDSVTATFRLNFRQAQKRSTAAGELLRFCAFLAPDAIPEEIVTAGASSLDPVLASLGASTFHFHQALEALQTYSLLGRDTKGKTLSIHRLVQAVLQDTLGETEKRTWGERVLLSVNLAFPNAAFPQAQNSTWSQCERLLAQAFTVAQIIEHYQIMNEEAGQILYKMAVYLQDRGNYTEAEHLYRRAIHVREQQVGPDHLEVAYPLNSLANLYYDQGNYAEAEVLYRRALSIREQQLGPDHPEMADPLNNLGNLYNAQGNYREAEPLLRRALHIREQQLSPEMAYPLNNLGNTYRDQGNYAEAEPLYRRALHIWEQQLGPDHPLVAIPVTNLANISSDRGQYAEAAVLFLRALSIRERQWGPEHPKLTLTMNNLGKSYQSQGKYGEAELLYQRALRIGEQQLGSEHPQVASSLNNLASLYEEQGKFSEAEPLYQRALHILERQLGPEHIHVAISLNGLANIYYAQGRNAEAEGLYLRALSIREQQLGPDHPDIVFPLNGLANIYRGQEHYAKAEPLYLRALHIGERHFGPDHSSVAHPLNNLGHLYKEQGNYAKAEPLYQRALHIWEHLFGPDHILVAHPLNGLAGLYREQGDYAKADLLYQRALHIRDKTLGPHSLATAEVIHGLARLYDEQKNSEKARYFYARALTIREQALGAHHPKTVDTRKHLITFLHSLGLEKDAARVEIIQSEKETSGEE